MASLIRAALPLWPGSALSHLAFAFFLLPLVSLLLSPASASTNLTAVTLSVTYDRSTYLILGDVALAYQLVDSALSFSSSVGLDDAGYEGVKAGFIDYGLTSTGLTNEEAIASPDVVMFPILFSAIVPVYRLDGLSTGVQLVLSRANLALIYMGAITWWNDSRLALDNAAVSLPPVPILVVFHNESIGMNAIFTLALSKFHANFTQQATVGASPTLPLASYSAYRAVAGTTAVAAAVVSTDGSIGYASQSVALELGVDVAAMLNKAGEVVQASAQTVTFAAVELGTQTLARTTEMLDLTDGSGSSVWPICTPSYLLVDAVNSRGTCHARAALIDYWLWFYQSSVVDGLVANRQYARVPDVVMSQLNVLDELQTSILCRGQSAYTASTSLVRQRSVSQAVSFLCTLLSHVYIDPDTPSLEWIVTTLPDQIIFEQLVNAEVDIGVFIPDNVDATMLQAAKASGDFAMLPVYLVGYTWMFNPQITPDINIQAYPPLRLDVQTIGLIWYSCVVYWNDPRIIAQNPWLTPLIGNLTASNAVPIERTIGCGSSVAAAPIASSLNRLLASFQAQYHDPTLASCMANFTSSGLSAAFADCLAQPQVYAQFAPSENSVPSVVQGTVGAQGYFQANSDPSYGTVAIPYSRNGQVTDTVADLAGIAACAQDTWDPVSLTFSPDSSANSNCWPWHVELVAMVRTAYTSTAVDTSSCERGLDSLQFLYWLITQQQVTSLVNSQDIVKTPALSPDILAAFIGALDGITCDGRTLLITLPTIWAISPGVSAFAQALCSIGLILCFVICGLIVYHRAHPVIRSASPMFLLMSVVGVVLLFSSGYVMVAPASDASCSVLAWLLLLGLQLTFAPLFAKTWRIYRIFGRKKLSVVQITNRRLLLVVGAILVVDVVLLAVWQAFGSLSALTRTVTSTSGTDSTVVLNEYTQCGVASGTAQSAFVVMCIETGLLFVFGALMAFTTRRVSSTFNESSGISLSIYNVCFTVGIITPIILVVSAVGDVLTLLLIFALLWIAYFTTGILFIPKLMKIYYHADGAQELNPSKAASSSSSGYQFLSLAALSSVPQLQSYVMALEKHLVQAQGRLVALKGGSKRTGSEVMNGTGPLLHDSPAMTPVSSYAPSSGSDRGTPTRGIGAGVGASSRLVSSGRDERQIIQQQQPAGHSRTGTGVRIGVNRVSVSETKGDQLPGDAAAL